MTLPSEIVGELVDGLRLKRAVGASPSELVHYLENNNIDLTFGEDYFGAAFLSEFWSFSFFPRSETGDLIDAEVDHRLGRALAETGDAWRSAPPYPDLLSRRDREAFRAVARNRRCHVIVETANLHAREYRDRADFGPWPTGPLALSRQGPPNAGLMAADPDEPRLQTLLQALQPACSWEDYVNELSAGGLTVSDPSEGYVISDAAGRRFYPTYRIQGIYNENTQANLWRSPEGEAIRRELNSRMGTPLVAYGPQDIWRFRDAPEAGPFAGPLIPALWFDPVGNTIIYDDETEIRRQYKFVGIPWPYADRSSQ